MVHCTFMRSCTARLCVHTLTFWFNQPHLGASTLRVPSWPQLGASLLRGPMADGIVSMDMDELASTLDLLRETMTDLEVNTNIHNIKTNT